MLLCVDTLFIQAEFSMAHKIESIDVELIDKSILLIQQNWMSFQINGVIDLIRSMWMKIYSSCSFSTVSRGNARKIGGSWHSRHNNVLLMHANCIDLYESSHVKSTGIIEYESIACVMSWIESESVVGLIPSKCHLCLILRSIAVYCISCTPSRTEYIQSRYNGCFLSQSDLPKQLTLTIATSRLQLTPTIRVRTHSQDVKW